jgi:hypothetical protein
MRLRFKKGPDQHNDWIYGCPPTWEWEKDGGGYKAGRDFFTVHWQVNIPKPGESVKNSDRGVVRLHVESPRYEVDRLLNDVKGKLVSALLDSQLKRQALKRGLDYRLGRRVEQTRENKCTEALRVIIPESHLKATDEENILAVHTAVGAVVEKQVKSFASELNGYFGNANHSKQ